MPRLFRIQFGVRHLLLLILVAGLVSALVFREGRFQAATDALRAELAQSRGVLKTHGLEWQLDDLKKDHVRVSVFDYAPPQRGANVRNPNYLAHSATITSIGPASVYLIDNNDASATPRLLAAINAAPDEVASATISMFAHYSNTSGGETASLEYSIDVSSDGRASGSSYVDAVPPGKQLPQLLRYDLTSGDYPRGQPIDFYRKLNSNSAGSFSLMIK